VGEGTKSRSVAERARTQGQSLLHHDIPHAKLTARKSALSLSLHRTVISLKHPPIPKFSKEIIFLFFIENMKQKKYMRLKKVRTCVVFINSEKKIRDCLLL
jgi:hypothetical protein